MRVENNFINTFDNFTKQNKSPSQALKANHTSLDKLELSPICLEVKYDNGSMQNHMAMHEALQNKLQTGTIYEKLFGGSGSNLNEFIAQNPIISRGGMAYKLRFDDENGMVYDERLVRLLSSKYTNDDDFKKAYLDIKNDIEEEVELSIEIDRRIMEENDIALANDYNKGLSVRDLAKIHGIQTFDELTKDIKKFDGVYDPSDMQRAYLGVSKTNRPKLRARLESEFMKGMLFYGMSQKEQEEWIANSKNIDIKEIIKMIESLGLKNASNEQNDIKKEIPNQSTQENPTKDEGIKRKAIEGKSEKKDEKLHTFESDLLLQKLKEREILYSLNSIATSSAK